MGTSKDVPFGKGTVFCTSGTPLTHSAASVGGWREGGRGGGLREWGGGGPVGPVPRQEKTTLSLHPPTPPPPPPYFFFLFFPFFTTTQCICLRSKAVIEIKFIELIRRRLLICFYGWRGVRRGLGGGGGGARKAEEEETRLLIYGVEWGGGMSGEHCYIGQLLQKAVC